jgi:hypothetical protein
MDISILDCAERITTVIELNDLGRTFDEIAGHLENSKVGNSSIRIELLKITFYYYTKSNEFCDFFLIS